jgi:hypothetical protein
LLCFSPSYMFLHYSIIPLLLLCILYCTYIKKLILQVSYYWELLSALHVVELSISCHIVFFLYFFPSHRLNLEWLNVERFNP